jgi:hypothetical protein
MLSSYIEKHSSIFFTNLRIPFLSHLLVILPNISIFALMFFVYIQPGFCMRENMQYLPFGTLFISLNIMISISIHFLQRM